MGFWDQRSRAGKFVSVANQHQDLSPDIGVSILGFKPESSARKAGLQRGDVIIEYDGEGNLTTDKLATLATEIRQGTSIRLTYIRDGHKHFAVVPPGSLGISVMESSVQSSFGAQLSADEMGDPPIRFLIWGMLSVLAVGACLSFLLFAVSLFDLAILALIVMFFAMVFVCLCYFVYRTYEIVRGPKETLAVVLLFLVGLITSLKLIPEVQDELGLLNSIIYCAAAFFALLGSFMYFIPSLREGKGTLLGVGVGMWIGNAVGYVFLGSNAWDWWLFRMLMLMCYSFGGYIGYKIVDEKHDH